MHEMALCESIVEIIGEQARLRGFRRVRRVCVEVGPFSGVETEALKFGFDAAAGDTPAEGAVLEICQTPGRAQCRTCEREVTLRRRFDPCPLCGGVALRIIAGDELRIKELEVL